MLAELLPASQVLARAPTGDCSGLAGLLSSRVNLTALVCFENKVRSSKTSSQLRSDLGGGGGGRRGREILGVSYNP